MAEYDDLAKKVEANGWSTYWYGPAPEAEIVRLEQLLSAKLPASFKRFLREYGGGGIGDRSISGIEDGNAAHKGVGNVYGDTLRCRQEHALPPGLVVVLYYDDEVCWCLDTTRFTGEECPVVAYDVFQREVDRIIAPSFAAFMTERLTLYSE
jgi:antitoxin YobK